MERGKNHIFSSILKMWKCKTFPFPSWKSNQFFPSQRPKLINVRNVHSSYCDTDSPFQSSSVKLLPVLGFSCNERIFHEVKVEAHAGCAPSAMGSSTISLHCQFWKLQGVFSPLSYSCVELIATHSSKIILYCWLWLV